MIGLVMGSLVGPRVFPGVGTAVGLAVGLGCGPSVGLGVNPGVGPVWGAGVVQVSIWVIKCVGDCIDGGFGHFGVESHGDSGVCTRDLFVWGLMWASSLCSI